MEVDPIAEVYTVTIHVPRLDDFDVDFDSLAGANDFIEFMKAADVRGWWQLWLTEPEGASDLRWG